MNLTGLPFSTNGRSESKTDGEYSIPSMLSSISPWSYVIVTIEPLSLSSLELEETLRRPSRGEIFGGNANVPGEYDIG